MEHPAQETGHGVAVQAALARAHQLWALLYEVEECAAAVPPAAMADLLASRSAGDTEFALVRAWLDAVRVAQASLQAPHAPPFAPQPLRLAGEGGETARQGAGALHARALRVGVAR